MIVATSQNTFVAKMLSVGENIVQRDSDSFFYERERKNKLD